MHKMYNILNKFIYVVLSSQKHLAKLAKDGRGVECGYEI